MLEGRKPRGRAAFIGIVVVASLCLGLFAAWCVYVIRDVSALRSEVGQRVHWMQVVRRVERATQSGDAEGLDAALNALDAELPALRAAGREDPSLSEVVDSSALALRALDRAEVRPTATPPGLAELVPALRRQTAARSVKLGRYWTALYMLVGSSIVFAVMTLTLYVRNHGQRVRQAEHDAARLHAQLLRADRLSALGTLAATVAHEINNPLSFVLSNLEVVEDQVRGMPSTPELQTSIAAAREGVRRVATIVRDLRGMSHPGKAAFSRIDVHNSLDAAIRICEGEARDRAQIVRDYGKVPRVYAGEDQLGQVFLNLLVNAIQAIEPGRPGTNAIIVRTRTVPEGVLLEICDSGPGIDPRHVDRLFEPFVTTKDVGEGTGLGLYVCRSIVESMQGHIQLEPMRGGGTRAAIMLPVAPQTDQGGAPSVPIHGPSPTEDQQLKILIIDDEEMLTSALARSLRGHEVHTANRGPLAVEIATSTRFDLILCDLIMPEMTGMDVFEALHAADETVRKRFVFMTGATVTSQAQAFADRIEAPVLEKPFSRAELLAVLDRFL